TPLGRRVGLVGDAAWALLHKKEEGIAWLSKFLREMKHDGDTLETWLRRTETSWDQVVGWCPEELAWFAPDVVEQVVLEAKYAGSVGRQAAQVERFRRLEGRAIPAHFDFAAVPQLRAEAREKLGRVRPANLGQASRISGISPSDLAVLLMYLR